VHWEYLVTREIARIVARNATRIDLPKWPRSEPYVCRWYNEDVLETTKFLSANTPGRFSPILLHLPNAKFLCQFHLVVTLLKILDVCCCHGHYFMVTYENVKNDTVLYKYKPSH